MADYAIVIGIDRYDNPAYQLTGAVRDAVGFAAWVRENGVPEENLRLLLSPVEPVDTAHGPADSRSIRQAISAVQNGWAAAGRRLYFYYAGHGLSVPGVTVGGVQEPVLVPSDMRDFQVDNNLLVGFSQVISVLRTTAPYEQVFFIDACRDFSLEGDYHAALGQGAGTWYPRADGVASLSEQSVLYAASPGQRAAESLTKGLGVFTSALLEGLRGAHGALNWSGENDRYEVRFSTLVEYVRTVVRAGIAGAPGAAAVVQEPQAPMTGARDITLTGFSLAEVGTVRVTIRVSPGVARDACELAVLNRTPAREEVIWGHGPPVPLQSTVDLLPFDYLFRATAPNYRPALEPQRVYGPRDVELWLDGSPPGEGGESKPSPDSALLVRSADAAAAIVVWNSEKKQVAVGSGTVYRQLPPGIYTVRLLLPDGTSPERLVTVQPQRTTEVWIDPPAPLLAAEPLQLLQANQIAIDERGYLEPAERLGPLVRPSLASLLAFAAVASNVADEGGFTRLRGLGVTNVWQHTGEAAVLGIVGSNRTEPVALEAAELIAFDGHGGAVARERFERLAAFPVAAQQSVTLPPGAGHLELRIPGQCPTRFSVACLPGHLTVLVVVLEPDERTEVQQYVLNRAFQAPDRDRMVRWLELAQRLYSAELYEANPDELGELLYGKWVDPLLGCIAGYSLIRTGRADVYRESAAMRNMLVSFGRLADSHVLAGLCTPAERDLHFSRALATGVPIFAEGFRALVDWCHETGTALPAQHAEIAAKLVPGSPWTAWAADRPTFVVSGGRFDPPAIGWDPLVWARDSLQWALPGVGRIQTIGPTGPIWGTTFVVEPGVVATPAFVFGDQQRGADRVTIDFEAEPGRNNPMEFVVRRVNVMPGTNPKILLLELTGPPLPPPLPLAPGQPPDLAGRPVAVIGHPSALDPPGVKRVQPGQLLGLDGDVLRHDCTTAPGDAGAPLIDLETGLVLGIHHSGRRRQHKVGQAVPLWGR